MALLLPRPDLVIMLDCPLEEQRRRLNHRNMSRDSLIQHSSIISIDELYKDMMAVHSAQSAGGLNPPLIVRLENGKDTMEKTIYGSLLYLDEMFIFGSPTQSKYNKMLFRSTFVTDAMSRGHSNSTTP